MRLLRVESQKPSGFRSMAKPRSQRRNHSRLCSLGMFGPSRARTLRLALSAALQRQTSLNGTAEFFVWFTDDEGSYPRVRRRALRFNAPANKQLQRTVIRRRG